MTDFPIRITQAESGMVATCPDLPEVREEAAPGQADEIMDRAAKAVHRAVVARMAAFDTVPTPAPDDGPRVSVPLNVDIDLHLHRTLRDTGITRAEIARRLGLHRPQVDRAFNPRWAASLSRKDQIMRAMGRRFVLGVEPLGEALPSPLTAPKPRKERADRRAVQAILVLGLLMTGTGVAIRHFDLPSLAVAMDARRHFQQNVAGWRDHEPELIRMVSAERDGTAIIETPGLGEESVALVCSGGGAEGIRAQPGRTVPLTSISAARIANEICAEAQARIASLPWTFTVPAGTEMIPHPEHALVQNQPLSWRESWRDRPRLDRVHEDIMNAAQAGGRMSIRERDAGTSRVEIPGTENVVLVCSGPHPTLVQYGEDGMSGFGSWMLGDALGAAGKICEASVSAGRGG